MALSTLLSFLVASMLLTFAPGPDNIFVLTESATKGRINGVAISIGLSLGVLVHTIIVVLGIALILQNNPILFNLVKLAGAFYLFFLAYSAYFEKAEDLNLTQSKGVQIFWIKQIKKGFLMNVLNPKVSLFFVAFLPQFVVPGNVSNTLQIIILGLIFMFQAFIIFAIISNLSGSLRKIISHPKFWNKVKWAKMVLLTLIGISILC